MVDDDDADCGDVMATGRRDTLGGDRVTCSGATSRVTARPDIGLRS
jgi:hypothetical protein